MAEENGTPSIDLEKGVITLKKGDDSKSFKLNDKNDIESLVKLGQRGWYFDEEASKELGELRKVVKNWDSAIEAARTDDKAMVQLKQKLELALGRPLTAKEERDVDKGEKPKILIDDEENSRLLSTIESLERKIAKLEQSQASYQQLFKKEKEDQLLKEINAEADKLEKKYNGLGKDGKPNGSPKFERTKVFSFASEKGIDDLEAAFKLMNFDKLTDFAKKELLAELKDQQEIRRSGFVETGDQSAEIETNKPKRHKTYHSVGLAAQKFAKNEGLNLFKDE